MSAPLQTSRMPRFNHVAMSVPADLLGEQGRTDLLSFYGEVFGWTEMPTLTKDRELFVLRAHDNEQFVFLVADPNPMVCPKGDHFGMSVGTPAEMHEMLGRAREFKERDDRVEIEEPQVEDFEVLQLHAFYARYLMPMRVEVQCYEWAPGFDGSSQPGD